jgi:hypothetical protein
MQKIELTITPNYVPSWGIVDAVRELFQNALDQQEQKPDNEMSWSYDPDTETLRICNKYSVLTANSLLLGQTTKADDASTIGQFGEGYKIATLVLLRNGKNVTFYNYGAKEVWSPRFVNSRRFGTQVLTFFIDKKAFWEKVPDADLSIEISGISVEEFEDIKAKNLHVLKDYSVVATTQYGDIIDIPGNVYVNGLFVCEFKRYKYGYNFKPEYLTLDRDRKMVSDFDLCWIASRAWGSVDESHSKLLLELINQGAADVGYIDSMTLFNSKDAKLRDMCYTDFLMKHGDMAIPVATQDELERVPKGYKGVMVPKTYNALIRSSSRFLASAPPETTVAEELLDSMCAWLNRIKNKLFAYEVAELADLIDALRKEI